MVGGADRRARPRRRCPRRLLRLSATVGKRKPGDNDNARSRAGAPVTEPVTTTAELARAAARAADDKKGEEIIILDVGDIMGIVESFVITSASNTRLVRTIVEEVERQLHEQA